MELDKLVSRRSILQGAAVAGATLAVESVMPHAAQASAGRAPLSGTLTFYAAQYTPAAPTKTVPNPPVYLGTLVKNYQALHPGVTVKLEPYSTASSSIAFTQYKATQFAGGTEPDIIYNNPVDANNLEVPKGWYLPLDSYMSKPNPYVAGNKAWADLFGTGILSNVTNADGHLYNLPMDAIDTAIFYNKTAFTKAGIAHAPASFAEWMDDMAALKKAGFIPYWLNAGAGGSDYMDWHERQLVDMLFYSDAGKLHAIPGGSKTSFQLTSVQVAKAVKAGTFSAKDPRYLEVLTLLKQLAGYAEPGFEGVPTTGSPYNLFSAGKLAMFQGTTFDINGLAALHLSFPYSSFEAIPRLTKATTPLASGVEPGKIGIVGAFANYNVTIGTSRDKNLPLAIDFLQYLSQPGTGGKMITQLGVLVPVLKNVPVPPGLKVFLPSSGRRDALFPGYVSRLDAQFSSQYYHVLQPFLLGQMDAAAAASQIQGLMVSGATRVLSHVK
jgi:raffinose/stachyose/melibiose transport system substrate-binding protein